MRTPIPSPASPAVAPLQLRFANLWRPKGIPHPPSVDEESARAGGMSGASRRHADTTRRAAGAPWEGNERSSPGLSVGGPGARKAHLLPKTKAPVRTEAKISSEQGSESEVSRLHISLIFASLLPSTLAETCAKREKFVFRFRIQSINPKIGSGE